MIFSRRALQRLLDELRPVWGEAAVAALAKRLNEPGRDRLAAMWEVAVFAALVPQGRVDHEQPLPSGRRPDITFLDKDGLCFTADIRTVSDAGLDDQNPIEYFAELIAQTKTRLKLPIGGVELTVRERDHVTSRGTRRVLRLPPKARLPNYVRGTIEPELKRQIAEGRAILSMMVDDENAGFDLKVGPGPYTTMSYGAYSNPTIRDRNPLAKALRWKADQLRGAAGLTGIIVADGDCSALAKRGNNWNEVTADAIVADFLRQYSSVDFVLLISVREEPHRPMQTGGQKRWLICNLMAQKGRPLPEALDRLLKGLIDRMPHPINMPVNAAYRARESGYGITPGAYKLNGRRITIGARALADLLAGRMTPEQFNERHDWSSDGESRKPNQLPNPFELQLRAGRLPRRITVHEQDEDRADDWVEIEFGDPDPAITPFH